MGRNSATPWTKPRNIALRIDKRFSSFCVDWFHGSAAGRQQQRVEYDRKVYSLTIYFTTIFPCLQVGTIFLKKVLYKSEICVIITFALWGRSSAGRAFGSHPRGREFESLRLHHKSTVILMKITVDFSCLRVCIMVL